MKNIKHYLLVASAVIALTFTVSALAQTNVPAPGDPSAVTPLPQNKADFWLLGIAGVTPLIVAGIRKLVPKIPPLLLPVSTPFIGMALGAGMNWLAHKNYGWLDLAQVGALAVFVRETVNQGVKHFNPPAPPAP